MQHGRVRWPSRSAHTQPPASSLDAPRWPRCLQWCLECRPRMHRAGHGACSGASSVVPGCTALTAGPTAESPSQDPEALETRCEVCGALGCGVGDHLTAPPPSGQCRAVQAEALSRVPAQCRSRSRPCRHTGRFWGAVARPGRFWVSVPTEVKAEAPPRTGRVAAPVPMQNEAASQSEGPHLLLQPLRPGPRKVR